MYFAKLIDTKTGEQVAGWIYTDKQELMHHVKQWFTDEATKDLFLISINKETKEKTYGMLLEGMMEEVTEKTYIAKCWVNGLLYDRVVIHAETMAQAHKKASDKIESRFLINNKPNSYTLEIEIVK